MDPNVPITALMMIQASGPPPVNTTIGVGDAVGRCTGSGLSCETGNVVSFSRCRWRALKSTDVANDRVDLMVGHRG